MANVKDIKLRIKAVKNTQQITKAMKMVAAARIKRAEAKVKASRPYTQKMGEMVANLVGSTEEPHPFFVERTVNRIGVLLVTSDKGLCGSYNSNLIRLMQSFLSKENQKPIDLMTVGNKGRIFFAKHGFPSQAHFVPAFYPEFHDAEKISLKISENFLTGRWDEAWILYSAFASIITQKPKEMRLLPLSSEKKSAAKKEGQILYEPDPQFVLNALLPQFLTVSIYNVLLEARAAELGARLVAMGNATDNAKKLIDNLTLQFYRARQESITKEILEVASGAEALKG